MGVVYCGLESAKVACTQLGSDCAGVYDSGCNDEGVYKLCKAGKPFVTSGRSCLHVSKFGKPKGTTKAAPKGTTKAAPKKTTEAKPKETTKASPHNIVTSTKGATTTAPSVCVSNGRGSSPKGKAPPAGTPCTGWYNGKKQDLMCVGNSYGGNGYCGAEAPPGTTGPYNLGIVNLGGCAKHCTEGGTKVCSCPNGEGPFGAKCAKHGAKMCVSCHAGFELNEDKTACVRTGRSSYKLLHMSFCNICLNPQIRQSKS